MLGERNAAIQPARNVGVGTWELLCASWLCLGPSIPSGLVNGKFLRCCFRGGPNRRSSTKGSARRQSQLAGTPGHPLRLAEKPSQRLSHPRSLLLGAYEYSLFIGKMNKAGCKWEGSLMDAVILFGNLGCRVADGSSVVERSMDLSGGPWISFMVMNPLILALSVLR